MEFYDDITIFVRTVGVKSSYKTKKEEKKERESKPQLLRLRSLYDPSRGLRVRQTSAPSSTGIPLK